jgi:ankyrin repeat protein
MVAVAADNVDLVLLLLERGAQINLQDESGTSSLMLSCLAGYTRVTKVLLGHGADVNIQNSDGITALMMSCCNGHAETGSMLMLTSAQ